MNKLNKAYYDPRTGFVGESKLYKKLDGNVSHSKVAKYLKEQPVVQKLKKPRPEVHDTPIQGPVGSYQIDLAFIPMYKATNDGFQVILTCVGINNRRGYAIPLKNKNAGTIIQGLTELIKQIRDRDGHKLVKFQSDPGSEFIAKSVQQFLENQGIVQEYGAARNHYHNGIIEAFNRTLKNYLNRWFVHTNNTRWIDVLPDILYNYNHTVHSGIHEQPANVDEKRELDIMLQKLENTKHDDKLPSPGASVRVKLKRGMFAKEGQTYSDEVHIVTKVNRRTVVLDNGQRVSLNEIQVIPALTNVRTTRQSARTAEAKRKVEKNYKAQMMYNRLMK